MKHTQKTISLLLALILAGSTAAACGEQTDNGGDTTTTAAAVSSDETTAEVDRFEGVNFGGETLNLVVRDGTPGETFYNEMYIEELTGDSVSDAIYNRNRDVSEKLGINVEYKRFDGAWGGKDNFINTISNSIMAGDDEYDLVMCYQYFAPQLVTQGLMKNLADYPYIDYTQPWWPSDIINELDTDGRMYLVSGDFALSMTKAMMVTFYNKKIAEDYDLDMYGIVNDGGWTVDKCIEIINMVSDDLNGDGQMTLEDDRFGHLSQTVTTYYDQFGVSLTEEDASGNLKFNFANPMLADIVEKMYSFNYDIPGVISHDVRSGKSTAELNEIFKSGRLMFYIQSIAAGDTLRDMSDDYGIIPLYKWDENQENYMTRLRDDYSLLSVPITARNDEMIGAFVEAIAEESYETVTPEYFINTLGNKVSRDSESYKMLELAHENIRISFEGIYTVSLENVGNMLNDLMGKNSAGWASFLATNQAKWENSLDKLMGDLMSFDN